MEITKIPYYQSDNLQENSSPSLRKLFRESLSTIHDFVNNIFHENQQSRDSFVVLFEYYQLLELLK